MRWGSRAASPIGWSSWTGDGWWRRARPRTCLNTLARNALSDFSTRSSPEVPGGHALGDWETKVPHRRHGFLRMPLADYSVIGGDGLDQLTEIDLEAVLKLKAARDRKLHPRCEVLYLCELAIGELILRDAC